MAVSTVATIKSAAAILGHARGHVSDMGGPRLVIDDTDGERIYAEFGHGVYSDAAMHFEAFASAAAHALTREGMARVATSLLSVLPPDMRADAIAAACERYHTPRVTVRP